MVKLFQIEEPDGSPSDPEMPGAAIGIDLGGAQAEVALSVGGNAALLADRDGFALDLAIPGPTADPEQWRDVFEGARLRAERALARPVTHAVIALASPPPKELAVRLLAAADAAGFCLLRIVSRDEIDTGAPAALGAAILAEELAPRPAAP